MNHHAENSRSQAAQQNQIWFVDVDTCEKENQTEEPNQNDAKGSYHLTERSWVLARGARGIQSPVSNLFVQCQRIAPSA